MSILELRLTSVAWLCAQSTVNTKQLAGLHVSYGIMLGRQQAAQCMFVTAHLCLGVL